MATGKWIHTMLKRSSEPKLKGLIWEAYYVVLLLWYLNKGMTGMLIFCNSALRSQKAIRRKKALVTYAKQDSHVSKSGHTAHFCSNTFLILNYITCRRDTHITMAFNGRITKITSCMMHDGKWLIQSQRTLPVSGAIPMIIWLIDRTRNDQPRISDVKQLMTSVVALMCAKSNTWRTKIIILIRIKSWVGDYDTHIPGQSRHLWRTPSMIKLQLSHIMPGWMIGGGGGVRDVIFGISNEGDVGPEGSERLTFNNRDKGGMKGESLSISIKRSEKLTKVKELMRPTAEPVLSMAIRNDLAAQLRVRKHVEHQRQGR